MAKEPKPVSTKAHIFQCLMSAINPYNLMFQQPDTYSAAAPTEHYDPPCRILPKRPITAAPTRPGTASRAWRESTSLAGAAAGAGAAAARPSRLATKMVNLMASEQRALICAAVSLREQNVSWWDKGSDECAKLVIRLFSTATFTALYAPQVERNPVGECLREPPHGSTVRTFGGRLLKLQIAVHR